MEADDPGAAGFVEMAADSIADALFEFGEGFGLGEDGLTEGLSLVAPFGRFLNQKDDFIHRLSYYISWGRGGPAPRPLYLTLALSAGGEGRGEVPSPFTERVRVRSHLPTRSLMSHSLIVMSPEPEASSRPSGLNATDQTT
jgi:hypothetical protein